MSDPPPEPGPHPGETPDGAPPRAAAELEPTAEGSLRSRIGKVAGAAAVALVVGELIALGQTIALARLLSPTEVGLFVAGGVLTTFVTNFVEGGLRAGLIHRERDLDDAAATVFWATLGTGAAMALAALAAAPLVGHVFDSRTAGLVAAALSGGLLLYALTNVPEALLQRQFSVRRRLIVGPAVSATFATVSVTSAALGLGVWSMVLGSYASSLAWVLLLWWLCDWRPWMGRPSFAIWRELAGYGLPLVLGMIGDRGQRAAEAVVTGKVLGAGDLGLLRYGERIGRIPVSVLVESGSVALFPAFARLARERERFRAAYLQALRLNVAAAAAMAALVAAVGLPLVVLVLGEEWRGAGHVLVAMAGVGLGKSLQTVGEEAIKGAGRTGLLNRFTVTETALSVVLLLVLIGPLGLVGVGLSMSLTALVLGLVVAATAGPVVDVSRRATLRATAPAVLTALAAFAVIAALDHLVLPADERWPWGLVAVVAECLVFLLLYAVGLYFFAPATYADGTVVVAAVWRRLVRAGDTPAAAEPTPTAAGPRPSDQAPRASNRS